MNTEIPTWANLYIGLPFEQFNCWQLVCKVYREQLGIRLPNLEGRYGSPDDKKAVRDLYNTELPRVWQRVEHPDIFTAVVFNVCGQPWHVGVIVAKTFMLHTFNKIDAVIERYTNKVWNRRIEGFYNYVG